LFHLDRGVIGKARLGVRKRPSLVQGLKQQVLDRNLSADQAAALLLVGDLQAHLPFALETAPFLRAARKQQAEALEAALTEDVLSHLDSAAPPLYEKIRDHCLRLKTDFTSAEMMAWSNEALGFLADALGQRNLRVRFELARAGPRGETRRPKRMERASADCRPVVHGSGSL
jgi:hypothetical protein